MEDRYSFAVHCVVEYDCIDVVRHSVDRVVEIHCSWNSETALRCACRHGHLNIVQLLLQRRADPHLHSWHGNDWLPIQIACMNVDGSLLKMLFEHSATVITPILVTYSVHELMTAFVDTLNHSQNCDH